MKSLISTEVGQFHRPLTRGEIGLLKRNNHELGQRLLKNNGSSQARSGGTQQAEIYENQFSPKGEWGDFGTGTPANAAQTYFWALTAGRGDKIGKMIAPPDELASQAASFKAQDFSNAFTEQAKQAFSTYKAMRIVKVEHTTTDEAKVTVQVQKENDETEFMPLNFRRIENEWNIQLDFFGPTGK